MVKVGDSVIIDGTTLQVEAIWAAGKHNRFKLSDGREVLALDAAIEDGRVDLVESKSTGVTGWGRTKLEEAVDELVDEEDEDE